MLPLSLSPVAVGRDAEQGETSMADTKRRGLKVLAAWTAPSFPLAALGLPLAVVLPNYYATHIGLPVAATGLAFMAVRLVDIGFDPVIGWAMDRTRVRLGRYRTWTALGAPLLMAGAYAVFMAPQGSDFWRLFFSLLLLYLGFSVATLAQLAWGSALWPAYDDRSRAYGWWQAGNIMGVLIALLIPVAIMGPAGGSYAAGVQGLGLFIIVATPLGAAINLWFAPEPRMAGPAAAAGASALAALFRRPVVRQILLCDLFLGLAPGVTGALLFFYLQAIKGFGVAQSQIFMAFYFLAGLTGAPLWSRLAVSLGKHRALQASCWIFAGLYCLAGLAPAGDFTLTAIAFTLAGLPYASSLLLTRAMLGDVADEVRLETGADQTGLLFSLLSLTTKLGYAFSVGVLVVLGWCGFDERLGAGNGDEAKWALSAMFLGLPVMLSLAAALVLRRYPLDQKRHEEIRRALEAPPPSR